MSNAVQCLVSHYEGKMAQDSMETARWVMAAMNHHINNELAVLSFHVDSIGETLSEDHYSKLKECIQRIHSVLKQAGKQVETGCLETEAYTQNLTMLKIRR